MNNVNNILWVSAAGLSGAFIGLSLSRHRYTPLRNLFYFRISCFILANSFYMYLFKFT